MTAAVDIDSRVENHDLQLHQRVRKAESGGDRTSRPQPYCSRGCARLRSLACVRTAPTQTTVSLKSFRVTHVLTLGWKSYSCTTAAYSCIAEWRGVHHPPNHPPWSCGRPTNSRTHPQIGYRGCSARCVRCLDGLT